MEQTQLLKAKLLKEAEILRVGPQAKILLSVFADHPLCLEGPQEAFIEANLAANLIGPESLVLSTRLKCEHIIEGVFLSMQIPFNIDSIVPKLMINFKDKKEDV